VIVCTGCPPPTSHAAALSLASASASNDIQEALHCFIVRACATRAGPGHKVK
jgi:hypothetical protein